MPIRSLEITPEMYLVEQEIPKFEKKPFKPSQPRVGRNRIWIIDVSGSMSSVLETLKSDLITKARSLPIGDTLTFAWFSSENGEYNFVLKGFKFSSLQDYGVIENTINNTVYARGTTCFSEVFSELPQVIQDLSAFGSNLYDLTFFTDGYPVVSNYTKEMENLNSAIEALSGKITSALLVGYGNYYNKELMTKISEDLGASLIHSDSINSFSTEFGQYLDDSKEVQEKIKLKPVVKGGKIFFSISGSQINLHNANKGTVWVNPADPEKKEYLYYLTKTKPAIDTVTLTDYSVSGKSKLESLVKATYALAYTMIQRMQADLALEVLSKLGDAYLVKKVVNAFTPEEYGIVEQEVKQAMAKPSTRFVEGRQTDLLPDVNAFCLLDALEVLMDDDQAFFYPTREEFSYKRIGQKQEQKKDTLDFTANEDNKSAFSNLTWNETKMNLSLLANIQGTVNLPEDKAKSLGLASEYPCSIFRNYAIVRDGFLNLKKLPCSMSPESRNALSSLISETVDESQGIVMLDFSKVPVINRAIARDSKISAKKLCKLVLKDTELEAQMKVFKWAKSDVETKFGAAPTTLSEAQAAFLLESGVSAKGIFSPSKEVVKSEDFYMAKEFSIKIAGLSSLPKVEAVIARINDESPKAKAKPLTASQELINAGLNNKDYIKAMKETDKDVRIKKLEILISDISKKRKEIRNQIQKTKFAILLGKQWFSEFASRDENKITVDGYDFTFEVSETKVAL